MLGGQADSTCVILNSVALHSVFGRTFDGKVKRGRIVCRLRGVENKQYPLHFVDKLCRRGFGPFGLPRNVFLLEALMLLKG